MSCVFCVHNQTVTFPMTLSDPDNHKPPLFVGFLVVLPTFGMSEARIFKYSRLTLACHSNIVLCDYTMDYINVRPKADK